MTRRRHTATIGVCLLGASLAGLPVGEAAADGACFGTPKRDYDAGSHPASTALGDVDGDGDLDLVAANATSDDVSVLLNDGDGRYADEIRYAAGDAPFSAVLGDVNGDGKLDIVTSNYHDNDVSVLVNAGDGTFSSPIRYGVWENPRSVCLGDVNGDGDLDIVVTNDGYRGEISILLNTGAGGFQAAVQYEIGAPSLGFCSSGVSGCSPIFAALGDVDGDGDLDIAVANEAGGDVWVMMNTGNGMFGSGVRYDMGTHGPDSIALGDVDGDGDLDMTVANGGNEFDVSVFLNAGDGTFGTEILFEAGTSPSFAAFGDVDGDGDLDMTVANRGTDDVSVLLNRGDGTYGTAVPYATGRNANHVALGDVDGDGDLDLAVANGGHSSDNGNLTVLLNVGNGAFGAGGRYDSGNGPESVAVGDMDGDGHVDMVTANLFDDRVAVLRNLGDGSYGPPVAYDAGVNPTAIALGDIDGDGDLDVVAANRGSFDIDMILHDSSVSVLRNAGDGTLGPDVHFAAWDEPQSITLGDMDGDGDLDIVVSCLGEFDDNCVCYDYGGVVTVLMNGGSGTFGSPPYYPAGTAPRSLAVGDVDGDGDLDIATVDQSSGEILIRINAGGGSFGKGADPALVLGTGSGSNAVALGDMDGDADLDLVTNTSVLFNQGGGSFAGAVAHGTGGDHVGLGDLDGDGALDLAVVRSGSDSVSVFVNDGAGDLTEQDEYGTGNWPFGVAIGDLNGDGGLDLAIPNRSSGDVSVILNQCAMPCTDTADCDTNGTPDCTEIASDPSLDMDENGILDSCETTCFADLDATGNVGFGDLTQVLNAWGPCNSICDCTTSQDTWQNEALGTFTGSFTMEFDHTPLLDSTDAAVMLGLSPLSGPTWDDYAMLVRLDPNGYYNVRNGNAYTWDAQVFYSAGVTNRIRIEANIAANTYSVWVTPEGGVETQIASNYAFRTVQQGITEIDTLGVWSVDPDAFTVCDVVYGNTGALGSCPCLPDLDGNGTVGFSDLTLLIAQWGTCR